MKLRIISLILIPFFTNCSKVKKESINDNYSNNCYDYNGQEKISNGCAVSQKKVVGNESTVLIASNIGLCTGSIISENFILTAAHCVFDKGEKDFTPVATDLTNVANKSRVLIGNNPYDLFSTNFIEIEKIIPNEIFFAANEKELSFLGDIALLKTKTSLLKNQNAQAIALKRLDVPEDSLILSIGFGNVHDRYPNKEQFPIKRWTTSTHKKIATHDQFVYDNQSFSNTQARYSDFLQSMSSKNHIDPAYFTSPSQTFFLTKIANKIQGKPCSGDSGGPQIYMNGEKFAQVSVTTGYYNKLHSDANDFFIKDDMCIEFPYAINTKIAPYLEWIVKEMAVYGQKPIILD